MSADPAQLEAEAAAAMATAPVEPEIPAAPGMPAAGPSPADIEAGYRLIGDQILKAGADAICPAWSIEPQERGELAEALAHACALWFPLEIPEKWVALIVLAGVGFRVVERRRDPNTGKLRPMRFARAAPADAPAKPVAPPPDPHAPIN